MQYSRGRIQLTFRLDKPLERAAYETIQSLPRKNKAEFIANCISECKRNDGLAECVAKKIYEMLFENKSSVTAPVKRKRGRPPKQVQAQKAPDISPVISSTPEPMPQSNCSETQFPSNDSQPTPNEDTKSKLSVEPNDSMLDEDMLRSMEYFINL